MAISDSYFNSLPASFTAETVVSKDKLPLSTFNFNPTKDGKLPAGFGVEAYTLPPGSVQVPGKEPPNPGWKFITAPEDISWDVSNQANRVDIFGTNNPPVVAGSRGMRDLKLGNSLVEGFVRGVNIEGKIAALENLMNYSLNQKDGFVGVPVYKVTANDKVYGNGLFIIKDISIKETMRDISGNATRAFVDISLMEVPVYQVSSGRDLASQPAAAAKALALPQQTAGDTSGNGAGTGAKSGTLGAGQNGARQAQQAGGTAKPTSTKPPAPTELGVPIPLREPPPRRGR